MRQTRIHQDNRFYMDEDQITGTTTDAYATAVSIDTRRVKKLALTIQNTGANSLNVQLLSRTYFGGLIDYTEFTDVTITAGNSLRYFEVNFPAEMIVQVKSTAAGFPTTYQIEYSGSEI